MFAFYLACRCMLIKNIERGKIMKKQGKKNFKACAKEIIDMPNDFTVENNDAEHTDKHAFDMVQVLKKGTLKLFYSNDFDCPLRKITDNIIEQAVKDGKKVMALTLFPNSDFSYFIPNNGSVQENTSVSGYVQEKDPINIIKELDPLLDNYGTEILYIPQLEIPLRFCSKSAQTEVLKFLYDFAYEKQLCVFATVCAYSDEPQIVNRRPEIFKTAYTLNCDALTFLPMEALCEVSYSGNEVRVELWECWNYAKNRPSVTEIKSMDGFNTFESVETVADGSFNTNDDLPF